jgi:transposase
MDRRTPRDWVHRYNETGLEGLRNRPNLGAPLRKLAAEQEQQVAEWVRQGPDADRHKVVRWRLIDLRDEIAVQFGVALHERSVGKLMKRLKFNHISARPRHPEQDAAAQETRKKTLQRLSPPSSWSTLGASRSSSGGRTKPASAGKAA